MSRTALTQIMSGRRNGVAPAAARAGLQALSYAYGVGVGVRNAAFNLGLRSVHRLPRPVISVGNLTTGGTGKTPMVIDLARRLRSQSQKPAILMRGYKADHAAGDIGDEARVYLAELGPTVPVVVNPDRVAGAAKALELAPDTTHFLLDDGFQHRRVAREVDIVLIDATEPWGYGRLLPRGLLREPTYNLARADLVFVTRSESVTPQALTQLDQEIKRLISRPPDAHVASEWTGFRTQGDRLLPLETIRNQNVAAIAGIGNPEAFLRGVARATGREPTTTRIFDDHDSFASRESLVAYLKEQAGLGMAACVTTEKDWVKWASWLGDEVTTPPILRPVLSLKWIDGEMSLSRLTRSEGDVLTG